MPIDSTMPGIERFFTIVGIRDAMGANTQYNTNKLRTKPLDLSRKWVVARLMTFETNTFFGNFGFGVFCLKIKFVLSKKCNFTLLMGRRFHMLLTGLEYFGGFG